jgi:hypothetical protein
MIARDPILAACADDIANRHWQPFRFAGMNDTK